MVRWKKRPQVETSLITWQRPDIYSGAVFLVAKFSLLCYRLRVLFLRLIPEDKEEICLPRFLIWSFF